MVRLNTCVATAKRTQQKTHAQCRSLYSSSVIAKKKKKEGKQQQQSTQLSGNPIPIPSLRSYLYRAVGSDGGKIIIPLYVDKRTHTGSHSLTGFPPPACIDPPRSPVQRPSPSREQPVRAPPSSLPVTNKMIER